MDHTEKVRRGLSTNNEIIALDFDGTLVPNSNIYPKIYAPIGIHKEIIEVAKRRQKAGAKLILWTCRYGQELKDAVNYMKEEVGLVFDRINKDYFEYDNEVVRRKIYATIYVDDKSPGSLTYFARNYEHDIQGLY